MLKSWSLTVTLLLTTTNAHQVVPTLKIQPIASMAAMFKGEVLFGAGPVNYGLQAGSTLLV